MHPFLIGVVDVRTDSLEKLTADPDPCRGLAIHEGTRPADPLADATADISCATVDTVTGCGQESTAPVPGSDQKLKPNSLRICRTNNTMGPSCAGVAGPEATAGVVVAVAEVVSVELVDVGELLELVGDSDEVVDDSDEELADEDDVVRVLLDDVLLDSEDSVSDQSSLSSSLSSLPAPNPNSWRRKSKKLPDWTEVSEASGPALAPAADGVELVELVSVVSVVDVALLEDVLDDVEVPDVPVVDEVVDEVGRLLVVP